MRIEEAAPTASFARHETFHLRYGWLKKCYNFVVHNNSFNDEDAPVKLGVGKNMAKSIRFWGLASKIIAPKRGSTGDLEATDFGGMVFDEGGLDPYFERPETAWLIHWSLLAKPTQLPVWWILFNKMGQTQMKVSDMAEFAQTEVRQVADWKRVRDSTIKRDVDAFMHTYTSNKSTKTAMEDYLDSPLRWMGLLQRDIIDGQFRFVVGRKTGMTPAVVAYTCLDFLRRRDTTSSTMSIHTLATEMGGPGLTLRLYEQELVDTLYNAANVHSDLVSVREVNGSQHLVFQDLNRDTDSMLERIYDRAPEIVTPKTSWRKK